MTASPCSRAIRIRTTELNVFAVLRLERRFSARHRGHEWTGTISLRCRSLCVLFLVFVRSPLRRKSSLMNGFGPGSSASKSCQFFPSFSSLWLSRINTCCLNAHFDKTLYLFLSSLELLCLICRAMPPPFQKSKKVVFTARFRVINGLKFPLLVQSRQLSGVPMLSFPDDNTRYSV